MRLPISEPPFRLGSWRLILLGGHAVIAVGPRGKSGSARERCLAVEDHVKQNVSPQFRPAHISSECLPEEA